MRGAKVLRLDGLDAASVDNHKVATVPVCLVVGTVARDAATLVHYGVTTLDNTVYKGGLADVGSTDHGDDRQ